MQRSDHKALERLQRLSCVGITKVMRTIPTAALEVLLLILPLHLQELPPLDLTVQTNMLPVGIPLYGTK